MELKYASYAFSLPLGWSISRYDVFDKCKRQYFYTYYSKAVAGVPSYKMKQLKELTSVPLEIGNVAHDVIETLLHRLQKSDSSIDESKFFAYAREKAQSYFSTKTFIETYYGLKTSIDKEDAFTRIDNCFNTFIKSPCFTWIFMKAMLCKDNWMIEPPGYGETRLDGLKAYCKMDFLFPVGNDIYILDWKTGRRDPYKHKRQLIGYAAAASSNFSIPAEKIFPKIIYLSPSYDEFEVPLTSADIAELFSIVKEQTAEMKSYCTDADQNLPKDIAHFPQSPSPSICNHCNYRELCFPGKKGPIESSQSDIF